MEIKQLKDLKNHFKDISGYNPEMIIYRVDNIEHEGANELSYGITTIYPGTINGEYFMTKGHKHNNSNAEVYYCLKGSGVILENNEMHKFEAGNFYYIQPNNTHRVVNTGEDCLKFISVYISNSGHNYDVEIIPRLFTNKEDI